MASENAPKVDPKGKAALIVAALGTKPKSMMGKDMGEESENESEDSDYQEAKMDAAEGVMNALKSGDKAEFASALEDFIDVCGG